MLKLRFSNIRTSRSGEITLGQRSLNQSIWWIGRDDDCDITLDDERVSRKHAKIFLNNAALYIQDAESRNGVFVNSEKLDVDEAHKLSVDDYIQLGETSLLIEEIAQYLPSVQQEIPSPQGIQLWQGEDINVRCFRIVQETSDTKTFWFCGDPPILFQYYPGQFITLEIEIDGEKVRRPYSVSSSPANPYAIAITVKRVSGGAVSNWLNDNFKIDSRASLIGGALGKFTCVPNVPKKMLFVAAGSGITPLMSMMRWVHSTPCKTHITLLYSVRNPHEVIFKKDILKMSEEMTEGMPATLRPYITVTRPEMAKDWAGLTGRISKEMVQFLVPDLDERTVFCCGPNDFTASVRSILFDLGLPEEQYNQESFGQSGNAPSPAVVEQEATITRAAEELPAISRSSSAVKSNQATNSATQMSVAAPERNGHVAAPASPAVAFTVSSKEIDVDGETTILEAAQDAGVSIPYSCKAGVCGACRVKCNGEVFYNQEPTFLTPEQRSKGVILACIAQPVGRVEVEA